MNAMIGSVSSMKVFRVTIAFALVFWISGLGCILGCETSTQNGAGAIAAAPENHAHSAPTVNSGASCHKAAEHSCCTKRSSTSKPSQTGWHGRPALEGASEKAVSPQPVITPASIIEIAGVMMRECPMALNVKALGTRARTDESATSIALEPIEVPLFNAAIPTESQVPSFLNNRGHTYLRCCVFLI